MRTRDSRLGLLVVSIVGVIAAAIPATRHAMLRVGGATLVASDAPERADVGVLTEFGEGGELEIADLYRAKMFTRVVVLDPAPSEVDLEYERRHVFRDDAVVTTLRQLGIPESAIIHVDAGEGGTTESADALAEWIRIHPSRAIVVVVPSHTRRYRRALRRVWPPGVAPPMVTAPRHNEFRSADWWRSRRTLREGLEELQKLALDYVLHPL
jgi:hypothetical protein